MVRVILPNGWLFVRDLLRPEDDESVQRVVATYAADANAHQRKMFDDSLRAALTLAEIRLLAARWHIASVHLDEKDIVLGYRNRTRIDRLAAASNKRVRVVDVNSAYLRMQTAAEQTPDGMYHLLKMVLHTGKQTV